MLANYECCGMKFDHGQALTDHMRSTHSTAGFTAVLSCCGVQFRESEQLRDHMKSAHHADVLVET